MKIENVIETARLWNNELQEDGTAYILDRLKPAPTDEQIEEWENLGAIVSQRAYRYAPEIRETFVFVPDSVMKWACPDEECSGLYGENPQLLEFDGYGWACPNCGCHTIAPIEDACITMIELV